MAAPIQTARLKAPTQLAAANAERLRRLVTSAPATARPKMRRHASARALLWLQQGDGRRFFMAAAALIGMLVATYFLTSALQPNASQEATNNASTAEAQAAAKAHAAVELRRSLEALSVGSIVFATHERLCQEIKFDNRTGQLMSVDSVDCEARLTETTTNDEQAEKTARMRGVLDSFKQ